MKYYTLFHRFACLCRPNKSKLAVGVLLILVATILTLPAPWIFKLIIDDAIPARSFASLIFLVALFLSVSLLRAWLTMIRNRLLQHEAMRIACALRIQLFAHMQTFSLGNFGKMQTGTFVSRIAQDAGEINTLINVLTNLIADSLTIISVVGFLLFLEWRLAIAVCAIIPLFIFNYLHNQTQFHSESRSHRQNWDRVLSFLHERIAGAQLIKAFAREQQEVATFSANIGDDFSGHSRIVMRTTKQLVIADFFSSLGALIVLGFGGWLVIRGNIGVGTLVAFYAYIAFIFPPIVRFVDLAPAFQRAIISFENVLGFLHVRPEVVDLSGAVVLPKVRGDIEFREVCFRYESDSREPNHPPTIRNVSFNIPTGTSVAIVGSSGAGKSTIVNLLAKFYEPISGDILVDGYNLRSVKGDSFRRQIGIVPQETQLFSGTLVDNLRYGNPNASYEEIVAAATSANAHDFILSLPNGYNTVVGERGVQLSGGERQRIAIARAILNDPRILILDEATSAIDIKSERIIQQAIEQLMKYRTTFIVAHRFSTIEKADLILVMEKGQLIEKGNHSALLAAGGHYAHFIDTHFR